MQINDLLLKHGLEIQEYKWKKGEPKHLKNCNFQLIEKNG
jgi:hypothetical protein